MKLIGRKVEMVRCHIDPNLPGLGAKNAFNDQGANAHPHGFMEMTVADVGIHVKVPVKRLGGKIDHVDHLIPYANLQNARLKPQPITEEDEVSYEPAKIYQVKPDDITYAQPITAQVRKMGRPPGSKNKPKDA